MVSYAELCRAIERWQRSQGRVSPVESALAQAMWRGYIEHNTPDLELGLDQVPHEEHAFEDDHHAYADAVGSEYDLAPTGS